MTMNRREKLVNLALGVGTLINSAIGQAQPPPASTGAAIGLDFKMVGQYLSQGTKTAQVEIKDAPKAAHVQLRFDAIES